MTEQTAEQIAGRIRLLETKLSGLQSATRLAAARDRVEDLDGRLHSLRPNIQDLRGRGYVFGKGFETRADGLQAQWRGLRSGVLQTIERQSPELSKELQPLEAQFAQIRARAGSPNAIKYALEKLEQSVKMLEEKVSAAERGVSGMYDSCESQTSQFTTTLSRLGKMLDQFECATFRLLPTEGAVMAVKAVFSRDEKIEKEDPDGFLYLTDQRLLFEQNEELATKKVLFITTAKKKVQNLLLDVPLALVETVQASKKGLFGHEDHLAITFQSGAPYYQVWFHMDGQDSNEWQQLIGQARSGMLAEDRAVQIDPEQVRKVQAAPSQCPNCGAPVTQVVLRGMDHITCAYCQFVIRL